MVVDLKETVRTDPVGSFYTKISIVDNKRDNKTYIWFRGTQEVGKGAPYVIVPNSETASTIELKYFEGGKVIEPARATTDLVGYPKFEPKIQLKEHGQFNYLISLTQPPANIRYVFPYQAFDWYEDGKFYRTITGPLEKNKGAETDIFKPAPGTSKKIKVVGRKKSSDALNTGTILREITINSDGTVQDNGAGGSGSTGGGSQGNNGNGNQNNGSVVNDDFTVDPQDNQIQYSKPVVVWEDAKDKHPGSISFTLKNGDLANWESDGKDVFSQISNASANFSLLDDEISTDGFTVITYTLPNNTKEESPAIVYLLSEPVAAGTPVKEIGPAIKRTKLKNGKVILEILNPNDFESYLWQGKTKTSTQAKVELASTPTTVTIVVKPHGASSSVTYTFPVQ